MALSGSLLVLCIVLRAADVVATSLPKGRELDSAGTLGTLGSAPPRASSPALPAADWSSFHLPARLPPSPSCSAPFASALPAASAARLPDADMSTSCCC